MTLIQKEPKAIKLGTTDIKKVYLGSTQVRPASRLPSEYKEVEYIQTTNASGSGGRRIGAYIDTGFKAGSNTKVEFKAQMSELVNQVYFGGRTGAANTQFCLFARGDANNYYQYSYNNTALFVDNVSGKLYTDEHVFSIYQDKFFIDGSQLTTSSLPSAFTTIYNMYLFGLNNGGSIDFASNMKLWYFEIWDSGTLIRDFVPCYRKSDSVIGMYDTVNNQFYTNAGIGTFTKGPDV